MTGAAPFFRRYTFKLYPNIAQDIELHRQRRMHAELWNALLEMRFARKRRTGCTPSYFDQSKDLTQLRQEIPEWAALSSDSMARTAQLLDLSFRAYSGRLKRWREALARWRSDRFGRPPRRPWEARFKRLDDHETIPFRKMGSGWKLTAHEANGNWCLYVKNVSGLIRVRGKFPRAPLGFRNMDILWRSGAWWLSVAVAMDGRRVAGDVATTIEFDLIQEFARENRAMGERLARPEALFGADEGRITSQNQGVPIGSPAESLDLRGDDGASRIPETTRFPAESLDLAFNAYIAGDRNLDRRKSDNDTRRQKYSRAWKREKLYIAKRRSALIRRRNDALHCWSSHLISRASDLTIVKPNLTGLTRSARGDPSNPGGAVRSTAEITRLVLQQACGMAIQMLGYKAAEVGIRCDIASTELHASFVGQEASKATKIVRQSQKIFTTEEKLYGR